VSLRGATRYGIRKAKDNDSLGKLFAAYLRRAEESVLGKVLVKPSSSRHSPLRAIASNPLYKYGGIVKTCEGLCREDDGFTNTLPNTLSSARRR